MAAITSYVRIGFISLVTAGVFWLPAVLTGLAGEQVIVVPFIAGLHLLPIAGVVLLHQYVLRRRSVIGPPGLLELGMLFAIWLTGPLAAAGVETFEGSGFAEGERARQWLLRILIFPVATLGMAQSYACIALPTCSAYLFIYAWARALGQRAY